MADRANETVHDPVARHAHANPNSHDDAHGHDDGGGHGSMRDYVIGFLLSVVLTAIPFWLVMVDVIADRQIAALTIMGFAVAQILVHMIYFLHMNSKSEGGWTLMALIFTVIIVAIALTGSLWVMYHLNSNMMPQMQGMEMDHAAHMEMGATEAGRIP